MNHYPAIAPVEQPAFLVFEGLDGCGKSRQAQRTASILRDLGHRVCLTGEPTGFSTDKRPNVIGDLARRVLRREIKIQDWRALQLVYAADRLEHVTSTIQPALNSGEIVVCDRYDLSTLLYGMASVPERSCSCGWTGTTQAVLDFGLYCPRCNQCGTVTYTRDDIAKWLRAVGSQVPRPTATIIIETLPEICASRRKSRKSVEFFDDDDFQVTLAGLYSKAADHMPCGDIVITVNGSGSADDVTSRVRAALSSATLNLIPA